MAARQISPRDSMHLATTVDSTTSSPMALARSTLRLEAGRSGRLTSVVFVDGSDFNLPYGAIPDSTGTFTGTLANGDLINAQFEIHGGATIVLVPEPSAFVLFGIGILAIRVSRQLS